MAEITFQGFGAVQFFYTDWDVPGHPPVHDLIIPTVTAPLNTLTGDLLLVLMMVQSTDLTASPTQSGWTLEDYAAVTDRLGDIHGYRLHFMVWSKVADMDGVSSYNFTEAYHSFTGIGFEDPDFPIPPEPFTQELNKINLAARFRGTAVSWRGDTAFESVNYPPGTLIDTVAGVGAFPDLTLDATHPNGSLSLRGARISNFEILPLDSLANHANVVFEQIPSQAFPAAFVTISPDYTQSNNGSIGGNVVFFKVFVVIPEIRVSQVVAELMVLFADTSGGSPIGETVRFDAGIGSSWYLVPAISDSGVELRSKTVGPMHLTGRRTSASFSFYTYDVDDGISTENLEDGTDPTVGPIAIGDSAQVAQSARLRVNIQNSCLHTIRIAGSDVGQSQRDQVHEIVYEVSETGVRR